MKKHLTGKTVIELIVAVLPFVFYAAVFHALPSRIATHYNAAGAADAWAPRLSAMVIFQCALGFAGFFAGKGMSLFIHVLNEGEKDAALSRKIANATEVFLTALCCLLSLFMLCKSLFPHFPGFF